LIGESFWQFELAKTIAHDLGNARASLRSVLFRIAFKAAFTCRVSMQITEAGGA
jgi:hypothetical protein